MNEFVFPQKEWDSGAIKGGLTLRDYFAAKAMQTFIVNRDAPHEDKEIQKKHCEIAYSYADAMLTQRSV